MSVRSPFEGLRMPVQLACDFFAVFSRFEYVLKEMRFLIPGRRRAVPDWRRFAKEAATWLTVKPGSAIEDAISYLNSEPPEVQTANGWQAEPLQGDTRVERALDATCRVRHNLFHGGKHSPASPHGRDQRLVEAALAVLTACLEENDTLRTIFEQTDF